MEEKIEEWRDQRPPWLGGSAHHGCGVCHGLAMVISVLCAWVSLLIWIQFLGLICIILRFMHIFLRLRSVLALSGFDCRFECIEPIFRRKTRNWGQPSKHNLQKKPNRANTDDPRQDPRSKAKHQNAAFGKWENRADIRHHRLPVVFTTTCVWGGTVVLSGTHGRAFPSAPDLRFSFASFRLPARFSGF